MRMTKRIRAGIVAAAQSELRCIIEMATEGGNASPACLKFHANSANRYMATMHEAGIAPPEFVIRNRAFLAVNDWRLPYGWAP
jgi:hypothetical protein